MDFFSVRRQRRHSRKCENEKQGLKFYIPIPLGKTLFLVACLVLGVTATFFIFKFWRGSNQPPSNARLLANHWGVSSGHPLATQAGMEILEQGGNAMEAAVAVAYTLSVVEPYACGLGGGGEMMVYCRRDRQVRVFDYRETAPSQEDVIRKRRSVAGVPGFTAGMEILMRRYGSLPRALLMKRAIEYAQQGFPVHRTLADLLIEYHSSKLTPLKTPDFFNNGCPLSQGAILRQARLGKQLQKIMKLGSQAFYNRDLINDLNRMNDPDHPRFTLADLRNYQVRETAAVKGRFSGYDVYAPPPPGGGISLLEMLGLAEISGATRPFMAEEERSLLLFKGMAIAYADRRKYLGDPSFGVKVPSWIHQTEYLKKRWQTFDNRFTNPANDEEHSTTHFVVTDAQGNWVSCTQTLGDLFGSGQMLNGYFFNNSLNKFSNDEKSPNRIAPGKRPFSYISPALLFKSGRPFLALGTPGGSRIPAVLTQMLIHHLGDSLPLEEAVAVPRYFINPDRNLLFEKLPSGHEVTKLRHKGFRSVNTAGSLFFGAIQALEIDPGTGRLIGAADPRRDGSFACRNLSRNEARPKR